MNTASRMLVTVHWLEVRGDPRRGLPELFSACLAARGTSVGAPIWWTSRDVAFTPRRFYGYRLFRRYSPIENTSRPTYAWHVSELCALWIFNEQMVPFFRTLPRSGGKAARGTRSADLRGGSYVEAGNELLSRDKDRLLRQCALPSWLV